MQKSIVNNHPCNAAPAPPLDAARGRCDVWDPRYGHESRRRAVGRASFATTDLVWGRSGVPQARLWTMMGPRTGMGVLVRSEGACFGGEWECSPQVVAGWDARACVALDYSSRFEHSGTSHHSGRPLLPAAPAAPAFPSPSSWPGARRSPHRPEERPRVPIHAALGCWTPIGRG